MANINQDKVRSVFLYLIGKAVRGEIATYKEVALHCGLPSTGNALGGVLGPILGQVFEYCQTREMPYLTVLVVRGSGKEKGLPGEGFWNLYRDELVFDKKDVTKTLQQQVFDYFDLTKLEVD